MLVCACGKVCAKVVEGKEKDVSKLYFRDADVWDYTEDL